MPAVLWTYTGSSCNSMFTFKEAVRHAVGPWYYSRFNTYRRFNFHSLSDHFGSQISLQVIAGMAKEKKKNFSHKE